MKIRNHPCRPANLLTFYPRRSESCYRDVNSCTTSAIIIVDNRQLIGQRFREEPAFVFVAVVITLAARYWCQTATHKNLLAEVSMQTLLANFASSILSYTISLLANKVYWRHTVAGTARQ